VALRHERPGHINCNSGSVLYYRRPNVMAAMLSLMLACGCAHSRKAGSGLTMPSSPLRSNPEASEKRAAARRAEDNTNPVVKRLERIDQRSPSPAETADRAVTQMGTGKGQSASTTGMVSNSSPSGASSSVVVTQPNGAIDPRGSTPSGTAAGSTPHLPYAKGGLIVGSVLLAGCLIAAIVWLPRRLNAR
jgi:cobalamin biosynthesis Mg chelatase CobN